MMARQAARRAVLWALLLLAGAPAHAVTVTYMHTDAQGSVVAETDEDRNIVQRYEYEPYGLPLAPTTVDDAPGYTGHVHDADSGLLYMQQRYYDAQTGRFLSIDPVGVSSGNGANFNRYAYANNNPYTFIDPDGRYACTGSRLTNNHGGCMSGGGFSVGISGDGGLTQNEQTAHSAYMINEATELATDAIDGDKAKEGRLTNPTGGGIRSDDAGDGAYGASRGQRPHLGIDLESVDGQTVKSPVDGVATNFIGATSEYPMVHITPTDKSLRIDLIRILYVDSPAGVEAWNPYTVSAGQKIGTAANLQGLGYGNRVTPHVHLQVRDSVSGGWIDPAPFFSLP
jgi:RHS repeat-associated protein